ncbi:MAG: HAD-IA family hydrolase [Pseudomonadales bacterium]|nr:HAD-IA family hydrolase [Pseudomonadales bacterium]
MKTIRLLTFDLDNTLWNNNPVIVRAEHILYQWLEKNCERLTKRFSPQDLIEHRMQLLEKHPELIAQISEARKRSLHYSLLQAGYSTESAHDASNRAFAIFLEARNRVELFGGVRDELLSLKQDFTIGALTNGNVELHKTDAADLFDFHVSAEDVNERKPGKAQFQFALTSVNAAPWQCIHIGDHPLDDIRGAASLGINTIWFNMTGEEWNTEKYGIKPQNCYTAANWKAIGKTIRLIAAQTADENINKND